MDAPVPTKRCSRDPAVPKGAKPLRATWPRRVRQLGQTLYGAAAYLALRIRHRRQLRDARPLASHLEREVFPLLRQDGLERLVLETSGDDGHLRGIAGGHCIDFTNTARLARTFRKIGVERIRLDTRLENGQVIDAILMLLRAWPALPGATPRAGECSGWDRGLIADHMHGPDGYHKFCARMRLVPGKKCFEVSYSYCELFFSRFLQAYVEGGARFRDHRLLFAMAPRAAIVALFVFAVPLFVSVWSVVAAVTLSGVLAVVAAGIVYVAFYTAGSIQYTREYHIELVRGYAARVATLSRFPQANPDPVLELDPKGRVLFMNPACRKVLTGLGLEADAVAEILPKDYRDLAARALGDAPARVEREVEAYGHVFRYVFSPFPGERSVIVVGTDVTYLKRIEAELRKLNLHLEELVEERTEELRQTQDATIISLAGLAEMRDPETGAHLERTRSYVKALAIHLRDHPNFRDFLDEHTIEQLDKSMPLHDIGKIGVPDRILQKPGKLTPEEYEEMKKHPIYGGEAIKAAEERLGLESFLRLAREIAFYHHERWDGKGYPFGLSGHGIPWAARLMALADVFDALCSRRYYKEPFPPEEVRLLIINERGKQFDPDAVDAFLELEDEFFRIAKEFSD